MLKKKSFKIISIAFVVLFGLILFGCTSESTNTPQDLSVSTNNNDTIIISGLKQNKKITVKEIMDFNSVTTDVTAVDSSGKEENYQVKGALLSDILNHLSLSQESLNGIRLIAGDGYQVEVPSDILKLRDIILAYEKNGKPIDENSQPVQIVIPDERAMYWVRNLIEIEILQNTQSENISTVIFMDTAFKQLPQEDYKYFDDIDLAIKVEDLLKQYSIAPSDVQTVSFKASDGFEKNEAGDAFIKSFIKITGKDAPVFLAPNMPKGMYVKNILFCSVSNTTFISGENIINSETNQDDFIKNVLSYLNFEKSKMYLITDIDGNSLEVTSSELESAVIFINNKKELNLTFNNQTVKNLLMIQSQ